MDNKKIIVYAVIFIAIYFLVIKKIFNFLGLTKGEGTRKYDDAVASGNSPFNSSYWRNYLYSGNTPSNGRRPITQTLIDRMKKSAKEVYNSFGTFTDDEGRFMKALAMCKSKAEVSLMSFYFEQAHSDTLLSKMKYGAGSLPENGLSEGELNNAFNFVNSLPTV